MLQQKMSDADRELIHGVVELASGVGHDYDVEVKVIGNEPDCVKVQTINEDDEVGCVAAIRVLGVFKHTDRNEGDSGDKVIESKLLGVCLGDEDQWRIIDTRGTSLFAILYV